MNVSALRSIVRHLGPPLSRERFAALTLLVLCSGAAACTAKGGPDSADAVAAASGSTSPVISEQDVRARLRLIADDSMQGRFTGGEGHVKVTEYIARELTRLGLRPGGENGTYFQSVPFVKRHLVDHELSADGVRFELGRDFAPLHPGGRMRGFDGARVVYGGILQDTSLEVTREQAAGMFVILVNRDPNNRAGNIRTARRGHRLETAAAIATVNAPSAMTYWGTGASDPPPEYVGDDDPNELRPAAFAISAELAERLLGQPADTSVALGTTGTVVHGAVTYRTEPLAVRNVIAILPGSDEGRSAEYVAVGAHSDHLFYRRPPADHDSLRLFNTLAQTRQRELGRRYLTAAERAGITVNVDSLRAIRPARPDSVYNGADDDGSGTVALIEIAEALSAAVEKPARSVLFVWHAAEELGLIGSRYFTDNPTIDRDAVVAYLNLDMIGRGGAADVPGGSSRYLQIIGWRRLSSELGDVIEAVNRQQAIPFVWDLQFDARGHPEQLYCRSDHYNYARYGIPVAFLSTGLHQDYHEVTDEVQYIDYAKLTRVTRLVRDVVVSIANLDHRPVVDGQRPDPKADCRQ